MLFVMHILRPLLVTLLSLNKAQKKQHKAADRRSVKSVQQFSIHDKRLQWAHRKNAVFLIDLENVRGKSNFELTHKELLKRTTLWSKLNNLQDRVSLIVDHGSIHSSYYLSEGGLSIVFAGTRMKADDVLARDVPYFERNVAVVTADNDLMSRCRGAMEKSTFDGQIQFIHPIQFITDLERLMNQLENEKSNLDVVDSEDNSSNNEEAAIVTEELANKIDEEIKLRGSLYETETAMREKKNMNTPKKRRKLEKRARQLCERLAMKGGQNIDHLTTLNGISSYDRKFQDEVLSQWENLRQTAKRREMTGDRILLAEYFRRQVENRSMEEAKLKSDEDHKTDESIQEKNTLSYSEHINSLVGSNLVTSMSSKGISSAASSNNSDESNSDGTKETVRLVVVSDTHGMEESLTPEGTLLPDGDILLHLGDFAIDGNLKKKNKAITRFDEWLARQPHRTKIVLRGNHDPFKVNLPLSNANFISMPKSIAIDGKITVTLVPYSSPRKLSSSWRKMPMYCDILASHSPPHGILDKCYNGANAGCASLKSKVERMIAGPPKLWLCGHIHEGRGMKEVAFGLSSRETVIINASNANTGRATRIDKGPIVLDFNHHSETVSVVQGDGIIESEESETMNQEAIPSVV